MFLSKHGGPRRTRARSWPAVTCAVLSFGFLSGDGTVGTGPDAAALVGTIEGTVRMLSSPVASPPPRLSPYSQQRYRPPAVAPTGGVEDVVVYLRTDSRESAPPGTSFDVSQRDLRIIPHVAVVQVGTVVNFPNEDDIFHNLFSLSEPKRFNLGRYPPGDSRSERFEQPGIVQVFCDIHSEMSSVILVLEGPWFTKPAADGSFRIADVPPGSHTLVVWHERLPPDSVVVNVPDGGILRVDLTLGG